MADRKKYLNFEGLKHFKEKIDAEVGLPSVKEEVLVYDGEGGGGSTGGGGDPIDTVDVSVSVAVTKIGREVVL